MSGITRRQALYGGTAALIGAALTAPAAGAASTRSGPTPFSEVYNGRQIQGRSTPGANHHHHGGPDYTVFIDGKELHIMQNADGSWVSVINHYELHSSPRALARAAVNDLQGAELSPLP
ncbi:apotyrosinase chaperone MelC1 [Streptomyces gobiensis]|uniref:apotyrosinase chaperone MelC1 n=1 Tax=Streptomyces gobiensis TaxID=2875706 RepID=UPI001E2FB5CA|nr:tyrosinase cofactor [Streptomyces gobiensis]UGY94572.1 tyrosinase cofactor [Streptomyces gobiensis]